MWASGLRLLSFLRARSETGQTGCQNRALQSQEAVTRAEAV